MFKNKNDKIIFITVCILLLAFLFYSITQIYRILKYRNGYPEDIIYINTVNDQLIYNVILKENAFIKNNEINNNSSFISSLVEYVSTNFIYEYQINKNVELDYSYQIIANVISEYSDETSKKVLKPIWNKEFVLVETKKGKSNNSIIKIDEKLNVGIDYYNQLVEDFKKELDIATNSILEIKLLININGQISNTKIQKEHNMILTIPLDVKAFDLATSKNFTEKESVYNKEHRKIENAYVLAIIYIIATIIISSICLYIIKKLLDKNKSNYILKRNKILEEYSDRIVTVLNFINYNKWEIVDLANFEEMINLSDESFEPIIYWENKTSHNKEAWFCILKDKILYRYIIYKKDVT